MTGLEQGSEKTAYKLDLAYVLTKMLCAFDEKSLPGRTGFNTMLHEDIPDVQRVGYLPVINALPAEYLTIREILKRSMSITEQLKLEYAVLVFDEAVYSKIQPTFDGRSESSMISSSCGLVIFTP